MSKLLRAAAAAALLTLAVAPAASASTPLPPTDLVHVDLIHSCPPGGDNPCDPAPGSGKVTVDKTYPSRLVAWAEGILP
jgi:hypothetical protein